MNSLAGFVGDVEFTLNDDLHFMVSVGVDERGALFEAVEAAQDRFLPVVLLTSVGVTKSGVFVGNQRGLEAGLGLGQVVNARGSDIVFFGAGVGVGLEENLMRLMILPITLLCRSLYVSFELGARGN